MLDLTSTYLHLGEGPEVRAIPVTDDFWPTIDRRTDLHRGRSDHVVRARCRLDGVGDAPRGRRGDRRAQRVGARSISTTARRRSSVDGRGTALRRGADRHVAHRGRPRAGSDPGDHLGRGHAAPAPLSLRANGLSARTAARPRSRTARAARRTGRRRSPGSRRRSATRSAGRPRRRTARCRRSPRRPCR